MKKSAFKAYDFRGVYDQDFDLEIVYKFGFFLPALLNTDKVLVGQDMRLSTPQMFKALSNGIMDAGANVYDMGLVTTPMVYFFTAQHHFDASVMITASHNPKEYNGLKVSTTNALPVGYDNGLKQLEWQILHGQVMPASVKGKLIPHDVKKEYLRFQSHYHSDLSNLKMVMDCSNGMASVLVKDIFGDLPLYMFDEPDGTFPHHEANPLVMDNVRDLQRKVRENRADIGVIFDGDADRVMFVDENGDFIPPDLMIAVLAHYFIEEKNMPGKVLHDIRTSKSVTEYIENMGREVVTWRVGRAYAATKLREIDGAFGGEYAGHYYFRDFFYSDSAMVASQVLLHVFSQMKKQGISVSQMMSKIRQYVNSGEINFTIQNKNAAIEAVKKECLQTEKSTKIMDFDGYRIEFPDWWFNIRPSNTEPYLRLILEARTQSLLDEKLEMIKTVLRRFQ